MSRGGQSGAWRPGVATTLKDRWALESELEVLSYGVLYAGRDLVDGTEVAVTAFHPAYFTGGARRANTDKVQRSREFHHPGIASTHLVELEGPSPYVVTQRALGLPLARWRREAGAVGMGTVYRLVGQLLAGLDALHAQGHHGALSPATLRVVRGHAWMHNPWTLETPPDLPAGELPPPRAVWLAPEQLYDVAPIGPATDVYSVGLVLGFLLACGLTEPGHSLMVQGIDVPPALDEVYVRATARQAELRYEGVAELTAALEAAAGHEWHVAQVALTSSLATGEIPVVTDDVIVEGVVLPAPPPLPADGDVVDLADLGGSAIVDASALIDPVERTVEEEAIPAFPAGDGDDVPLPVLAPTMVDLNTAETEAIAADADAFVRAQVAAAPGSIVEAYVVPPELEGAPPPLPPGVAEVDAPEPTVVVAAPVPPMPPGPPPLPPTAPGTKRPGDRPTDAEDVHDTSERLALAAGGESWVMDARDLSKAVMTGRPLEEILTRVPDPEKSSLLTPPPPREEAPIAASSDLIAAGALGSSRADATIVPRVAPGPRRRERRAWLWPAALLFLVAGGLAAYALLSGGDDTPAGQNGALIAGGVGVGATPDGGATAAPGPDAAGVAPGVDEADAGAAVAEGDAGGDDDGGTALAATAGEGDAGPTALAGEGDATAEASDAVAAAAPGDDVEELAGDDVEEPPGEDEDAKPSSITAVDARGEADAQVDFVPTDWKALNCPGGMMKVRRKIKVKLASGQEADDYQVICIDRYEYPGGGQPPRVNVGLGEAKSACSAQGKHLCTRTEWRLGCGGKYPYGRTYDPAACNTVGSDGMPRPVLPAGAKAGCRSGWGTMDMVGNVAEWTSDGFVNGGSAYKHGEGATCYQASRRSGGHPYVGFRCCADAK